MYCHVIITRSVCKMMTLEGTMNLPACSTADIVVGTADNPLTLVVRSLKQKIFFEFSYNIVKISML